MTQAFPYTYYACPCVNTSSPLPILTINRNRKTSREVPPIVQDSSEDEDETFDPKSPRANFSLFPLDHLLWCSECHQIKCQRCVFDEVVCWYCPSCLFEVPSSTVRSEGNRCSRNCYNCPICTSPLTVNAYEPVSENPTAETLSGPFILACAWCNWTSLDIGIKLEKHNNVTSQLSKIRNGGEPFLTMKERELKLDRPPQSNPMDPEETFARLQLFYRDQFASSAESNSLFSPDMAFSSPTTGSLGRLLNIYSSSGPKSRPKPRPMREAFSASEGFSVYDPNTEDTRLKQLFSDPFNETASFSQRAFQAPTASNTTTPPTSVDNLRPVPALLRTKRAKRCRQCRTLLAKPEPRMNSSRWRIRTLAQSTIPRLSLRALADPPTLGPLGVMGVSTSGSISAHPASLAPVLFDYASGGLRTGSTVQFVLTVHNPLYDRIRVSLLTPAVTAGRVASRVTILCPEFDVGATSDVWDDALDGGGSNSNSNKMQTAGQGAGEAGKIWASGRNWTSVVLEVVPGLLPAAEDMFDDEEVCEVAIFVRSEYETLADGNDDKIIGTATREKREDAFWCVLGVGNIHS